MTNLEKVVELFNANSEKTRKELIQLIVKELNVSEANASVYLYKAKKRADQPAKVEETKTSEVVEETAPEEDETNENEQPSGSAHYEVTRPECVPDFLIKRDGE